MNEKNVKRRWWVGRNNLDLFKCSCLCFHWDEEGAKTSSETWQVERASASSFWKLWLNDCEMPKAKESASRNDNRWQGATDILEDGKPVVNYRQIRKSEQVETCTWREGSPAEPTVIPLEDGGWQWQHRMRACYIPITFKVPYMKQRICYLRQSFEVGSIITPLDIWRNRGTEQLRKMYKVTHLVSGRPRVFTQPGSGAQAASPMAPEGCAMARCPGAPTGLFGAMNKESSNGIMWFIG